MSTKNLDLRPRRERVFLVKVNTESKKGPIILPGQDEGQIVHVGPCGSSKLTKSFARRPTFERYKVVAAGSGCKDLKVGDYVVASKMACPRSWLWKGIEFYDTHESGVDLACKEDTQLMSEWAEERDNDPAKMYKEDTYLTRRAGKTVGSIAPRGGQFLGVDKATP